MFDCLADLSKLKGFKIKLYPTEEQKEFLNRQIALFRWVYNWTIDEEKLAYTQFKETGEGPRFINLIALMSKFSALQKSEEYSWLKGINTHTAKEAMRNALHAFDCFFAKKSRFPKYKSKKKSNKYFQVRNESNAFYFDGEYVRISGLPFGDKILCKNHPIPKGESVRYYRCTIKFDGYNYWLSLNTEVDRDYLKEHSPTEYSDTSIGIDVGYRTMAQLSTGQSYYHPNIYVLEKRKRRQQKRLAKMRNNRVNKAKQARTKLDNVPLTANEEKLQYQYYKTRTRIKNIKNYYSNKVSKEIANMFPKRIVMENLRVKNLIRQKHIARLSREISLYRLRTQIEYKCKDRGIEFVLADSHYPSTKLCSRCGSKYNPGNSKIYKCPSCGLIIDRDLNAAINLSRYIAT